MTHTYSKFGWEGRKRPEKAWGERVFFPAMNGWTTDYEWLAYE